MSAESTVSAPPIQVNKVFTQSPATYVDRLIAERRTILSTPRAQRTEQQRCRIIWINTYLAHRGASLWMVA